MTMTQRRSRRRILLLSFFVPVFAMLLLFLQRGIYPFGEESFLRTDLYHQYAPFFSEFQYKLQHGGSLFYSWNIGLGVNFTAIYAYYLASPLNWFVLLFPKRFVIEYVTLLIVVKTALSSVTMTYYLLRHSKRDGLFAPIFGILYAFSAYMAAYSWNVMWLDCIVLFPLILLGAEELVRGERSLKYIVCLGLSILSNYYISIMICLFLIFYAIFQAITAELSWEDVLKAAGRFALASLIAAGLAAVVLMPEIFALRLTASGEMNFPKTFESYFSIFDMMARQLPFVECEIGLDHWPNIYCGMFTLQLLLLYFSNREVPIKQRVGYAFFLLFFFASFSVNVLNYIWHGFHYPNSLPARQSFIFCFLVLYLSFQALERFPRFAPRELFLSFAAVVLFVLLAEKLVTEEHFRYWVFYLAFLLAAIYALLFRSYASGRFAREHYFWILLLLVTLEASLNLGYTSIPTTSRTEYTADNADIQTLKRAVPKVPFVRFKKFERKSKDDGAFLNFHSVSLFSSTADKSLTDFLRSVGCEASVNAYSITGSTPLVDALLDVRYSFVSDEKTDPEQEEVLRSGATVLLENRAAMPLGFVEEGNFTESWSRTYENPADVQNDLCRLFDSDPVLIPVETQKNGNQESLTLDEDGLYFAFATNAKANKIKVSFEDRDKTYDNLKRRYMMELGHRTAGETINFTEISDDKPEPSVVVYRFDFDALKELRQAMLKHGMQIDSYTDNTINAEVEADGPSLLFTSIPYDKGWKVYVDRKPVKTEKAMDAFLAFRVPSGKHYIHFRYFPEGLKLGAMISALSLLALWLLCRYENAYEKRYRKRLTRRYEALYRELSEAAERMHAESLMTMSQDPSAEPGLRVSAGADGFPETQSAPQREEESSDYLFLEDV